MLVKVISGGQTGVDQAALRAALASGLAAGGWCPPHRESEAGPIPPDFPLRETPLDRSPEAPDLPRSLRTEWNVRDAEATLVLRPGAGAAGDPGTEWALRCAARLGREVLVAEPGDEAAVERIVAWIHARRIRTLHVAGPSERACPGIGALAEQLLARVFASAARSG
jgi:hypothetical protein